MEICPRCKEYRFSFTGTHVCKPVFWAALDTRDYQRVYAENQEEAAEKLVEQLGYEYWNHEQEVMVLTEEPDDEKEQTPEVFVVEIEAIPQFKATHKPAPAGGEAK